MIPLPSASRPTLLPRFALEKCRAEIESQEAVIERLEGRLAEAERQGKEAAGRVAAAEAAAAEREAMIAYVGEEVERVKALFEQKVAGKGGFLQRALRHRSVVQEWWTDGIFLLRPLLHGACCKCVNS